MLGLRSNRGRRMDDHLWGPKPQINPPHILHSATWGQRISLRPTNAVRVQSYRTNITNGSSRTLGDSFRRQVLDSCPLGTARRGCLPPRLLPPIMKETSGTLVPIGLAHVVGGLHVGPMPRVGGGGWGGGCLGCRGNRSGRVGCWSNSFTEWSVEHRFRNHLRKVFWDEIARRLHHVDVRYLNVRGQSRGVEDVGENVRWNLRVLDRALHVADVCGGNIRCETITMLRVVRLLRVLPTLCSFELILHLLHELHARGIRHLSNRVRSRMGIGFRARGFFGCRQVHHVLGHYNRRLSQLLLPIRPRKHTQQRVTQLLRSFIRHPLRILLPRGNPPRHPHNPALGSLPLGEKVGGQLKPQHGPHRLAPSYLLASNRFRTPRHQVPALDNGVGVADVSGGHDPRIVEIRDWECAVKARATRATGTTGGVGDDHLSGVVRGRGAASSGGGSDSSWGLGGSGGCLNRRLHGGGGRGGA